MGPGFYPVPIYTYTSSLCKTALWRLMISSNGFWIPGSLHLNSPHLAFQMRQAQAHGTTPNTGILVFKRLDSLIQKSKLVPGGFKCQLQRRKKKNDKTSGFHVTKTRSDCILMDALHDRILMEDQKWWARAAFCSLATLRLLSPCSPMFITDKSKGTLPGTNISPFKRTFESMFFRFSFSLGYLSCLEGTSNSSALLHEQKPTFQTLKASHTAAMDAFCTQNHSAICKIGSNIINVYVFTQELIVYQGRAMPKEHDMISLVSVLLCSLHSPRMFALLRCCWGMVSNDGWLFVN